jgi:hypothetical protein
MEGVGGAGGAAADALGAIGGTDDPRVRLDALAALCEPLRRRGEAISAAHSLRPPVKGVRALFLGFRQQVLIVG